MTRRAATITQAVILRTIKAFQATGMAARQIEIDHATGKIIITPGEPFADAEKTALQSWRASRGAR